MTVPSRPIRVDALEVEEAEDGLVVYDEQQDVVHHLNPAAAVLFDLCDGSRAEDEIAAAMAAVFGLDAPPLEETAVGLQDLIERGLVRREGQPDATGDAGDAGD